MLSERSGVPEQRFRTPFWTELIVDRAWLNTICHQLEFCFRIVWLKSHQENRIQIIICKEIPIDYSTIDNGTFCKVTSILGWLTLLLKETITNGRSQSGPLMSRNADKKYAKSIKNSATSYFPSFQNTSKTHTLFVSKMKRPCRSGQKSHNTVVKPFDNILDAIRTAGHRCC